MKYKIELIIPSRGKVSGYVTKHSFEKFKQFVNNYELENKLEGGDNDVLGEKLSKNDRTCRFCSKSHPDVSFKKEAHVIPQLWNRAKPTSTFECDKCNERFSKFESDFGHYFLIERSMFGHKKKKGIPKYKTDKGSRITYSKVKDVKFPDTPKGKSLKAMLERDDLSIISIIQGLDDDEIKINDNSVEFKLLRKPYRPINIYKVFIKIALSLIPKNELNNFTYLMRVLTVDFEISEAKENKPKEFSLFTYQFKILKSLFDYPIVHLYKRKDNKSNYIEKTLVVFFSNSIYQIPVLSDDDIRRIYTDKQDMQIIKISPYLNPYISQESLDSSIFNNLVETIGEERIDLFSSDLIKDDIKHFEISQDSNLTSL